MQLPVTPLWRVELFGVLRVRRMDTGQVLDRFRSRSASALLAFLAYHPRQHSREMLIDLLWPQHDATASRAHLRVLLTSLRQMLEPSDVPAGSVLVADRHSVGLHPDVITTDVAAFEAASQNAAHASNRQQHIKLLSHAVELYRGPLLPGYYEDWIVPEAQRLEELFFTALRQLIALLEEDKNLVRAIEYARHGVAIDDMREEVHRDLMRLYAAADQHSLALRQYQELKRLLAQRLDAVPGPAARELLQRIEQESRSTPGNSTAASAPLPLPRALTAKSAAGPEQTALLPLQPTRFVGREEETARLRQLLLEERRRLVTLMGPGGSGKTRLALEMAQRWEALWPNALWFVPLADLEDAHRIADKIADAMRLPHLSGQAPQDQVLHALKAHTQPVLLILDNLEHLLAAATPLIQCLLSRVPQLQILLTSRLELRIAEECAFCVPMLPVPPDGVEPARLLDFASAQLFQDRAQALKPGFHVTRRNVAALARLCARLEGWPLAIELAAARADTFSPSQMLARLERRLDFLTEQPVGSTYRYPTLWAALQWSYDLLWPELQQFFTRLCVFRGGCTPEAAAAVTKEPYAAHFLQQLRIASLVTAEERPAETRFRLLETISEFALELLQKTGEEATAHNDHAHFFLDLAEEAYPQLLGSAEQVLWMERLERDNDNLRAALAWLLDNAPSTGLRLAVAVARFWRIAGRDTELRAMLERTIVRGREAPIETRIVALRELGEVLLRTGSKEDEKNCRRAMAFLEESAQLCRQSGDLKNLAWTLRKLGEGAQYTMGDSNAARVYFEESLAIERTRDDPFALAAALHYNGSLARDSGDFEKARSFYQESVENFRSIENLYGMARPLTHLAALAYLENNPPLARSYWEQSLPLFRNLQDNGGLIWALRFLSELAQAQGDHEAARALLQERLALNRELGNSDEVARALSALDELDSDD